MPSSLAAGPLIRFFRVARKLTIKNTAVVHFEPREAPEDGVKGDVFVDEEGNLNIHNGEEFVPLIPAEAEPEV